MHRIPPLPSIQEIIRMYGLTAKKKLSQNFLLDLNLTKKLVKAAGTLDGSYVIEVGPGPGGITRSILATKAAHVLVVEKDKRFLPGLEMLAEASNHRLSPVLGDVLDFNFVSVIPTEYARKWQDPPPNVHIIGNLPFNVATPLIILWLRSISTQSNAWSLGRAKLTLTFQKEYVLYFVFKQCTHLTEVCLCLSRIFLSAAVAERIVAPPLSEHRCRLSVMCQNLCDVQLKFTIPGKAFVPPPKVDVGIVHFVPKKVPLISQPFSLVERVNRHLFHLPNKFCIKSLSTLFPREKESLALEMLEIAEVSPEARPFQLLNDDIRKLCDAYAHIVEREPDLFHYDFRSQANAKLRRMSTHFTNVLEKRIMTDS